MPSSSPYDTSKHLKTLTDSCYKHIRDHGTEIKSLKKFIREATEQNAGRMGRIASKRREIEEQKEGIDKEISEVASRKSQVASTLQELQQKLPDLRQKLGDLEDLQKISEVASNISEVASTMQELQQEFADLEEKHADLEERKAKTRECFDEMERHVSELQSVVMRVELDISEAEANIKEHKRILDDRILEDVKLFQQKVWETLCKDLEPSLPTLPDFDRLYNPTHMEVIGEEDSGVGHGGGGVVGHGGEGGGFGGDFGDVGIGGFGVENVGVGGLSGLGSGVATDLETSKKA
ncbi:hypothetical protein HK102_005754 [Quaeritorhiza haematococci]|nr:hypothetical protein HK102_005754 [Quaeritorhiza haematococci]